MRRSWPLFQSYAAIRSRKGRPQRTGKARTLLGRRLSGPLVGNEFFPLCPQAHIFSGLFVEPAPFLAVEHCLSDNSRHYARPEIVPVIKMLDGFHHFGSGQAGVLEMRKLMATLVGHLYIGPEESV